MAAAWEIICVSTTAINSKILARICEDYKAYIKVQSIFSIDDWAWSNQQKIENVFEIEEKLALGKVIVIELESKAWESLGMYIEKDGGYTYTFWINTKGFPALDIDSVNHENKKYYDQAYYVLSKLIEKYQIAFQVIAIGVESSIRSCSDIKEMIRSSDHIVAWMVKEQDRGYFSDTSDTERSIEGTGFVVFELRACAIGGGK